MLETSRQKLVLIAGLSVVALLFGGYTSSQRAGGSGYSAVIPRPYKDGIADYFTGTSGVFAKYYDSEYPLVAFVALSTPAKRHGVEIGDQILEIDGIDTRIMTIPEIESRLSGTQWVPIKLVLKTNGQKERTAKFERVALAQCNSNTDRAIVRLRQLGPQPAEEGQKQLFLPYRMYADRAKLPDSVIFEFYDAKHPTAKVPPNIRWSDRLPSQTPVIRYSLNDPLQKQLAAKLGITRAPAYVYQLFNCQFVYESRIVRDSMQNKEERVLATIRGVQGRQDITAYGIPAKY